MSTSRAMAILVLLCTTYAGAQTVVSSARIVCAPSQFFGPIIGLVWNETDITIVDLQLELRIVQRDDQGNAHEERDGIVSLIPSLHESGITGQLEPKQWMRFTLTSFEYDQTCASLSGFDKPPNTALMAVVRVNGQNLIPIDSGTRAFKRAPTEMMVSVPRTAPSVPFTLDDLIEKNTMNRSKLLTQQVRACLMSEKVACTFPVGANANVILNR